MSAKTNYIQHIQDIMTKFYLALKFPISLLDNQNVTFFCLPTCEDNTWPSKNNRLALDNFYSFSDIKKPTLIILEKTYYLGIIPIKYNMYIIVGPILPRIYTLSVLLSSLKDIYTEAEIITYYNVNSEFGHIDSIRFPSIISLLCESLFQEYYSPKELYESRIIINNLPIIPINDESLVISSSANVVYLEKPDSPSTFSNKCDKFILSNLRDKISASELASVANVSERTLYRQFKEHFNMSPNDYINQKRLAKSLEMLIQTDMTISEISSYWGYSSQSHFTKAFEKQYKKTPGEYRKEFKNRSMA